MTNIDGDNGGRPSRRGEPKLTHDVVMKLI